MEYKIIRDPKYHGTAFSVSQELEYHGKAAEYIRSVYEAEGVDGLVRNTVFERNVNTFKDEEIHSGLLALDEYKVSAKGVTASLEETGFVKKFLTLTDIQVDVFRQASHNGSSLAELPPLEVEMHSQPIVKRVEFPPTPYQATFINPDITTAEQRYSTLVFGLGAPTINELNAFTYGSGAFDGTADAVFSTPPELFTAKESGPCQVELFLDTQFSVLRFANNGRFGGVEVWYWLAVDGQEPQLLAHDLRTDLDAEDYNKHLTVEPMEVTLDLRIGDKVYLYGQVAVSRVTSNVLDNYRFEYHLGVYPGSYLRLKAITSTPATKAKGLLVYEALQRCVESITDTPGSFYSEYFGRTDCSLPYAVDGPGSLTMVTSSWLIRNFPLADKPFFVAFDELLASLDAAHCLGVGIEMRDGRQVVRVEPRSHFYQPTQVLRLDNATEQQKRVLRDRIYNTVSIGYQRWKSGNENGLREFNGKRAYVLPISRVKGSYSALSPYVAAGYVIEETRRDQYVATPDKENSGDGQNFLVCLRRAASGGFETERDQAFALVEGVLTPSQTYNLRLSPGRMLRRHGAWLRTGLVHQADRMITLGPPEGNEKLVTQLLDEAAPLDESLPIRVDSLAAPLFYPEEYQFKSQLSIGQLAQLRANPYRLIYFPDAKGVELSGYLLSVVVAPASRACTFTLLRFS
jgi:hypothetical protein